MLHVRPYGTYENFKRFGLKRHEDLICGVHYYLVNSCYAKKWSLSMLGFPEFLLFYAQFRPVKLWCYCLMNTLHQEQCGFVCACFHV